jgi:cobyrinic acid a,c-diamide synthase
LNSDTPACPALLIAAPASGQGKTTVTAAVARLLRNQGKTVRVFKTGPDYLDPQVLEQASGWPVEPLDLWMAGEAYCRQRLHQAARQADFILVEGAMGLFDGEPSSADLAVRFNLPVLVVMNVKGMAQTTGAVLKGLAAYRDELRVVGLLANACASQRHRELIEAAMPEGVPLLAGLPREAAMALPERHLGLVQADEVHDELESRFEAAAGALQGQGLAESLADRPAVAFPAPDRDALPPAPPLLEGLRIAVARDAAFSFLYQANLDTLAELGARIVYCSPLADTALPDCDALWLPGGYPELYGARLAANRAMKTAIRDFYEAGRPIVAECGGLLYCLESLTDYQNEAHPMLGLLPGQGYMRGRRGCQGMQTARFPEGEVRGHAHHRSLSENTPEPVAYGQRQRHAAAGEAIYRRKRLTATYLHVFFPNNPAVVARLFRPGDQTALPEAATTDERRPDAVE